MHWYRVILDEAAVIRNKATIVSNAVTALKSNYNWTLTVSIYARRTRADFMKRVL